MQIEGFFTIMGHSKGVDVRLSGDEVRCICNALSTLYEDKDADKDKNFNEVYANIIQLNALTQHGYVPEFEIGLIHKLLNEEESETCLCS